MNRNLFFLINLFCIKRLHRFVVEIKSSFSSLKFCCKTDLFIQICKGNDIFRLHLKFEFREREIGKLLLHLLVYSLLSVWSFPCLCVYTFLTDVLSLEGRVIEVLYCFECNWMIGLELQVLNLTEVSKFLPAKRHGPNPHNISTSIESVIPLSNILFHFYIIQNKKEFQR